MRKQGTLGQPSAGSKNLWGNAGLALLKGGAGWFTGSQALLADAFRSATDLARDYASSVSQQRQIKQDQRRPADLKSRQAGGDQAFTLVISLLLLIVGIEICISAVRFTADGIVEAPHGAAMIVITAAWLLKILFFPEKGRAAAEMYVSAVVLLGTFTAWLGGQLDVSMLLYGDPAAAFAVGAAVAWNGYRQLAGGLASSRASGLAKTDEAELSAAVQRMDGVIAIGSLSAWEQGHYVAVEVTISVNPRITVQEGHEIARRVREHLLKRFIHLSEVQVHVDPYDGGYPYKSNHDPNEEHIPTLLQ
ncbi:cation diffusion facilitator family transporter [Paenibacillus sambharensis]|uniref:Cation diffusion facilitator family transporter n=1 Tax=Paenibacillus sambharensis TaxID=1803190 RepID=A0A2W1LGL5_9BACL|nr:cation transporter dimerization domain-containing protein [Paenibacillus sambharensis]PZD94155.1 cation diffusion facilitator family transporter [Paenibacillus sambharensis]